MNSKLFKKLNEKMELNSIKNQIVTEEERKEVEKQVVFENSIDNLRESLEIKSEE